MSEKTKRVKGVTYVKPIVYGNIAWWLGKKADPEKTHEWTAYIRGAQNEDLSYFIKKVVINLHDSFSKPKRTLYKPPYEVSLTGWGEFELNMKIFFKDPIEKPITLYHQLRLFPEEGVQTTKRPVVSETYDEIVFVDPTENMLNKLKKYPLQNAEILPYPSSNQPISFNEENDLSKIREAQTIVRNEIQKIKEQYDRADEEIELLKNEILNLN
eukprot:TRINITY_DN3218_c0_g1_i1.p1 TRINITY_DN3218_c0_g1~~TRINITY_DN3218_c0_g1_i1.p1  ORF type:complete len:213 (+),score=62.82 TRINITY_DN3218_c0_g1_i1:38-676(+)